jgi:hypothetical protein
VRGRPCYIRIFAPSVRTLPAARGPVARAISMLSRRRSLKAALLIRAASRIPSEAAADAVDARFDSHPSM